MNDGAWSYPHNSTMKAISAEQRRAIVTTLLDEASPVTVHALASRLLADEASSMPPGPSNPERQTVRLVHRQLPVLAGAELVDWNRAAATVERGSHPALEDPRFRSLLEIDSVDVDAVFAGLSHDHRRIALTVLRGAPASVTTTDLAREIRRQEPEVTGRHPTSVDDILVSLHHGHLPTLAEADLVGYDPETSRATYSNHPALERVFQVMFASSERTADRYATFLDGLHDSYAKISRDASEASTWPHHWRDPSHG